MIAAPPRGNGEAMAAGHSEASELKRKAALGSIFASAALTLGKLVAGLMSGSLALLSEAAHGLLDTGATIVTYFAVRVADRPADDRHHYGHAKVEAIAALAETAMLMALAAAVLVKAVERLMGAPAEIEAGWLAFGVLIVSIVVDFVRYRALDRVAKETKSDALAADALHFSSDLVASALVLLGLIAARFGFEKGDALAAVGVSVFIAVAGWKLGRRTIDTLTDAAPQGEAERLRALVEAVPGVLGVDSLRLREAGPQIVGELVVGVARTLPHERVGRLVETVRASLEREAPQARLTIATAARALDDETVIERVMLAAARRHLPVHHVTVQQVEGRFVVGLDLEVDGAMTHGAAHEIASELEAAIRAEIGEEAEVDTHIEPLEPRELSGQDASPDIAAAMALALEEAGEGEVLFAFHNVRVRETVAGLVVTYHCRARPDLTVAEVHDAVDRVDHRLRRAFPGVVRVIGHAEPPSP